MSLVIYLVNGLAITLPDGRLIDPEQVLGEARKGTSLVVVGDTGRVDNILPYVQDADGLVIEATYINAGTELAENFSHITAAQAAGLAKDAGVKNLYLTHLSRRYRERDVLEEAQSVMPNAIVARDFDRFQIKHDEE